jgi:hypothetical protein
LNDPKQPFIHHGNTCTFEQDVISTANVLPRAPEDMEGCMSVIFTGPKREIAPAALKKIFHIHKALVLDFLHWLQSHNSSYSGVNIDLFILNCYSDPKNCSNVWLF